MLFAHPSKAVGLACHAHPIQAGQECREPGMFGKFGKQGIFCLMMFDVSK
jgi:hypothetical protein